MTQAGSKGDMLRPAPVVPTVVRHVATDLPGVKVGVAEYDEGPTGCTVLAFDAPAPLALDVRGGIPAVFNPSATYAEAICLAGGSLLGLDASSGVAKAVFARHGNDPHRLPRVSGGVIYDYAPAGRTAVYPDDVLGATAYDAAVADQIPVGPVGAARSATCGKLGRVGWAEPGGQGAAFAQLGNVRILVLVVVNALGVITNRAGEVVRGNRDPETGERTHIPLADMVHGTQRQIERFSRGASVATTLTVVVTDAVLRPRDHAQLARQVHVSLARAIHPFHCTGDGDALWFASTGAVRSPSLVPTAIGSAASELAWDAVVAAVS